MTEIDRGIVKLERRLTELMLLDPYHLVHDQATRDTIQRSIRDTVRDIFGQNSQEAKDFQFPTLYYDSGHEYFAEDDWRPYGTGICQLETLINGLIARLKEKRADLQASPQAHAFEVFVGMRVHPRISAVCTLLFRDGHYSQAVFEASKALINLVKEKSGRHDLDGVKLMTEVFSVKNPTLRFNEGTDQSELDEQQGMMHLFAGAALGIRNPRGHSFLADAPQDALDFIGFLSLLATRLETTTNVSHEVAATSSS